MTKQEVNAYLRSLERKLLSTDNWQKIELTREWANKFPKEAGVYVVREDNIICYVGETALLRSRMKDLLDTRNHVLRRKIGNTKFKHLPGFQKATSSKKFIHGIEDKLNIWIESNLEIATLAVDLGRKELEEFIYDKYDKPKYNSKGKRA